MSTASAPPRYTDLLTRLPATVPFVGPETQERARGAGFDARLGANESVFGPSPRAIAEAAKDAWMYGDPEGFALRSALASHHDVPIEAIVLGEGIDGLLGYLVRMLVAQGDAVVTSDGAYPTFNYHVAGFGGTLHKVPYKGDAEDPEALIAKAAEVDAKMIYIANPDNPMGSWHDAARMADMIDALPEGTVLALDEAYVDTAPPEAVLPLDLGHPRVIRFRTFSKAYGLAGLRVGYALAHPDFIAAFNRIRNHFGMGRLAQAGALAALQDQDYLHATVARIAKARDRIAQIARDNGLTPLPSATNFVTVDCGADGDFARAVLARLVARGIFVRMPFVAPQDRCIRISCGTDADLDRLADALPLALAEAR
ncbi:Histidinol-phosphate aminotransferase / Aromatic-amino-acid aminotransferase [Roseibacterium elongatum DSM 19469]|uniref:Histidinol-phosphate aminotransferase / Aromatic-amino-acid aminotransferase n=1 Tax=Roseicyclus elongatus DSM 19469 TaxID=1294273 RepID=W8RSG9_9RHOB|nr:pyridoxal phosphate-dependent aminotransferase [Roseibacterium elongatum]AHM04129.1 Histidinol-phosphate aminotransferase / Aromatic-amino-acid aminotransferase [Roseibacterium elongatum DSM 19469]